MRTITKSIGNGSAMPKPNQAFPPKINKVLICRPNARLGNLLLVTPLVSEITKTFPGCTIDLFVKGSLAPVLFRNHKNINRIIALPAKPFKNLLKYVMAWLSIRKQYYDMVINVDQNSASGRLSTQFARGAFKFYGDADDDLQLRYIDHGHIAKYPVYNFRNYLAGLGFAKSSRKIATLNLKLSTEEISIGKKALKNMVDQKTKTICLFTFATGNKCYPEAWWLAFYNRLKQEYPDYNIIEVLPIHHASQLGFRVPIFYSRDIRQIGALIANTDVFIGADSGIMHLAAAVKTPTIGLFSVTNLNRYQPYGNGSLGINTNETTMNYWILNLNRMLARKQISPAIRKKAKRKFGNIKYS